MTPADLKHRLLRLLRIEQPGTAPAYIQDDITQSVNAAYQVLWTQVPLERRSHYTRRIDSISLVSGTALYALGADVQEVIGPVYRVNDNEILMALSCKADYLQYGMLAQGLATAQNGPPEAYYLERLYQNADDATLLRLYIAPTPTAEVDVTLEVEIQAPRFETADFCAGTPPKLRIPHEYVESTLLPVAAWYASRSHWFTKTDLLPVLEADARRALGLMGVTDPQVASAEKVNASSSER